MTYDVSFETVEAKPFIGVADNAARNEIGQVIRAGLDKVWSLIRATPEIGTPGSSVVLYAPAPGNRLAIGETDHYFGPVAAGLSRVGRGQPL